VSYYFKKELGRGCIADVYLYEAKNGHKLVKKIFKGAINT
jgi:serine/threonine protein kinase